MAFISGSMCAYSESEESESEEPDKDAAELILLLLGNAMHYVDAVGDAVDDLDDVNVINLDFKMPIFPNKNI